MSREMGRDLHRQEPQLTLKNHNPGCMWGILHHFQHNRWHNVVKRLPRKRLTGSGKHHSSDQGRIASTSDGANVEENTESTGENRVVETKAVAPNPAHKSSMKSRLKALITDEMYRKKSRHRRSSTYPPRKPSDKAIQNQENSSASELPTDDQSNHNDPSPSEHPPSPRNSEENSSTSCETVHKVKYLKQNEASQIGKEAMRDHTVLHGNSIYAVEPNKCDSVQESKLFMDALDLLNVRQEVFLKILQDPSSSLAQQLHYRQTSNTRLTKSVSFPVKRGTSKTDEHHTGENSSSTTPQTEPLPPVPLEDILRDKKNDNNKLGLRRFKNIREKIRHVIRDKKKEKDRIIKDALHDKIPCDRKHESQRFEKSPNKPFKRTSSFNDSFRDSAYKYNQLLDITASNREGKDQDSDKIRTAPNRKRHPSLSRILSLPDLRSYSSVHSDDPASNGARIAPDTVSVNDQKPADLGPETGSDIGEDFYDLIDLRTAESFSARFDLNRGSELCFSPHTPKLDVFRYDPHTPKLDVFRYEEDHESLLEDSKFEGLLFFPSEEDALCIQKNYPNFDSDKATQETRDESQIHQFYNDLLQVQVDTKNEAEFNYVKEILELSGFTRDEILGQWHSADHPLDPSMFEELSAECEEAYASNDHLLLFDIINEVLLGIYERSICYWPRTLSSPARIHQLPKGNRVLEEVWAEIRWLLSWRPEAEQAIDDAVSRDLGRYDGWMNLQTEAECVGTELEDLIFDDLLHEIIAE